MKNDLSKILKTRTGKFDTVGDLASRRGIDIISGNNPPSAYIESPIRCVIAGNPVAYGEITCAGVDFGAPLTDGSGLEYSIEVDVHFAGERFERYYREYLSSFGSLEDDDDPDVILMFKHQDLRFARLMIEHPDLAARLILSHFASEFMGFLFEPYAPGVFAYIVGTLNQVAITDGIVTCTGQSVLITW